jgi:hypothetical protein
VNDSVGEVEVEIASDPERRRGYDDVKSVPQSVTRTLRRNCGVGCNPDLHVRTSRS